MSPSRPPGTGAAGWYIGLMSGTSLDGLDGVLAHVDAGCCRVAGHVALGLEAALRSELLALNQRAGTDELHRAALAANALARRYAEAVAALLQAARLAPADIRAIGAHGQTVRHQPGMHDGTGYTLQLNNPALLAERSGIAVVADFRSRDVAAGGQGAPLVPAFHRQAFADPQRTVAVLNLGGIANLSVLRPGSDPVGFDCGPANALMDGWCERHTGRPYDAGGTWAASGQVLQSLLGAMLAEPFFALPPPKSTGRDLFHMDWLERALQAAGCTGAAPQDVQATLAELTAHACAQEMQRHAPDCRALVVCGGGALNAHLMARLAAHLPGVEVGSSADRGLPPLQVEAAAFAWLAHQCVAGLAGSLPAVTGARGPRILGAIYPA